MLLHAPAKLNLCLYLGPRRDDGLHELCSLFEPLALADADRGLRRRSATRCSAPGSRGRTSPRERWPALRARGWERPAAADRDREADAGRGGPRRRQWRRRRDAAPARGSSAEARRPAGSRRDRRRARRRRPLPAAARPARSSAAPGERVERLPAAGPARGGPACQAGGPQHGRRLRRGRPARTGPRRGGAGRAGRPAARGGGAGRLAARLRRSCSPTTSSRRRARCVPTIGAALDALREAGAPLALLTGSGPTAVGLFPTLVGARSAARAIGRDDAIVCAAGSAP